MNLTLGRELDGLVKGGGYHLYCIPEWGDEEMRWWPDCGMDGGSGSISPDDSRPMKALLIGGILPQVRSNWM